MSDLISRSAAMNSLSKVFGVPLDYDGNCDEMCDEAFAAIDALPSIDAVPVVRCKECVCCSRWNDQLVCSRISGVMDGYYHGTVDVVKPDDYCSHGIRKTAKPLDVKMGAE